MSCGLWFSWGKKPWLIHLSVQILCLEKYRHTVPNKHSRNWIKSTAAKTVLAHLLCTSSPSSSSLPCSLVLVTWLGSGQRNMGRGDICLHRAQPSKSSQGNFQLSSPLVNLEDSSNWWKYKINDSCLTQEINAWVKPLNFVVYLLSI